MSTFSHAEHPKSLTLDIYERLRAEILDVRLEPGSRLLVPALVERFGVSQTAIREALSRLVAHGLVLALDQRGFRVSPISKADLLDATDARVEIESLAIRRSLQRGDAAWEGRVLAAFHELSRATPGDAEGLKGSMATWSVLHRRFHGALVSACQSEWLLRFRETLFDQSERYRKLSVAQPRGARDVQQEHQAIVDAAMARDVDRTIACVTDHFNATTKIVVAAIESRDSARP